MELAHGSCILFLEIKAGNPSSLYIIYSYYLKSLTDLGGGYL